MAFTEGARVYHDANQTVPLDSDLILAFNSERWDTDGIHDPVTNNSRLTCQTAGKYVIAGHAHFELGGVCVRKIKIKLNGSTMIMDQAWDRNPDGLTRMDCMTVYNLKVGDYVELEVRNGDFVDEGGYRIMALAAKSPEFMMQRIGPSGIENFYATLSDLKTDTTYHFRAKATNAAGTSYGEDKTFTTSGAEEERTAHMSAKLLSAGLLEENVL